MYRKARLLIKQLVEAVERMIEIQISEQIYENKQQKEKGEPLRQAHLTPRKLDELHLARLTPRDEQTTLLRHRHVRR